jgi:16S rRNA (guanine527-N7)-methyltransferase
MEAGGARPVDGHDGRVRAADRPCAVDGGGAGPDVAEDGAARPDVAEDGSAGPAPGSRAATESVPTDLVDVERVEAVAAVLFGDRVEKARRYAALLTDTGVSHGLIGPREADRVWSRHILNCAVLAELVEPDARVLDIGSGAGLPGIPLALARPDLEIVLLEPLARRVDWLRGTLDELGLAAVVVRGRAEEPAIRRRWSGADVVTARAVAPLARLAGWALPLLRPGGRLLAVKGASAAEEVTRDRAAVRDFGGATPRVVQCGGTHVDPPTTVVEVERTASRVRSGGARRTGG